MKTNLLIAPFFTSAPIPLHLNTASHGRNSRDSRGPQMLHVAIQSTFTSPSDEAIINEQHHFIGRHLTDIIELDMWLVPQRRKARLVGVLYVD